MYSITIKEKIPSSVVRYNITKDLKVLVNKHEKKTVLSTAQCHTLTVTISIPLAGVWAATRQRLHSRYQCTATQPPYRLTSLLRPSVLTMPVHFPHQPPLLQSLTTLEASNRHKTNGDVNFARAGDEFKGVARTYFTSTSAVGYSSSGSHKSLRMWWNYGSTLQISEGIPNSTWHFRSHLDSP